jgi:predicted small metal-binding protein
MKRIHCGDLVPGCTFKAQAETEQEVLHEETRHLREAHGLDATWQFVERARSRIRDTEASASDRQRPEAALPG